MQSIERANRHWEWLQCAPQNWHCQFNEGHAADQLSDKLAMRMSKLSRVNSVPHLVFEQSTRNERLVPEAVRR
jgi:hypothetical protein